MAASPAVQFVILLAGLAVRSPRKNTEQNWRHWSPRLGSFTRLATTLDRLEVTMADSGVPTGELNALEVAVRDTAADISRRLTLVDA
ncbi:hypothetical protein [Nocardia pseudovaccinii]|uniref:hypothetical protein n=1 Tax=Nocardia pseudovaccinii TaxID=189540 RepID=UPI0007A453C6|nr:hypothetical protein [Nocardia pseudovaccinii]